MKVSSGKYRSLKLESLSGEDTRPTLSKVKEAIFSMLYTKVVDAKVLDLFAGSGSLGIEALSNNASHVDFYDSNYQAIKVINNNLNKLQDESYSVTKLDYRKALANENKYDIIFLDPPYHLHINGEILRIIFENNLLEDDGLIVCESDLNEEIEAEAFEMIKEKKYGQTKIRMYRRI